MTAARRWYEKFLKVAVVPMLMAQAEEGLLFGAHLQNTLLRLDQGEPSEFYYRDCQGTGFSHIGSQLHRDILTSHCDERNQLSETMGNYLFSYYFIVNTVFSVIGTIALDRLDSEQQLLMATRLFIERLRQYNPRDTSCLDYLLNSPKIFFKGNLRCSLIGQNETTMADPLALYTPMANPLAKSQFNTVTQPTAYHCQESLPA
jgi:N2-citryl-N6-acetyl-N6-hydroxylysine synthase